MDIELRTHVARSRLRGDEPAAVAWIRAVVHGFLEPAYPDEAIDMWLRDLVELPVRIRGMHDHHTSGLRSVDEPVATLGSWDTTVNVGGTLLPVNAISDVTTRASHRRRGLLRSLMTADLADAAERGVPLAALTVSESGIYRRFGFGPAVPTNALRVRTDASFGITTAPVGRVEMVERAVYLDHARPLFAEFHRRTSGSVDRTPSGFDAQSGVDVDTAKPDPAFRYALHVDDDDRCDGAVAWKVVDEHTAQIRDMITPDAAVAPALWRFLGGQDLVTTVTQRRARVDDPVRYALVEPDVYTVENRRDFLWLRVLDVRAVLEARRYVVDGDITIGIDDDLGWATGTYRLRVRDGVGAVSRLDDAVAADVTMDVAALGSILLGGLAVTTIAAAGHIHGSAVDELAAIMLCRTPPSSITPF